MDSDLICVCAEVTEREILEAIGQGAASVDRVSAETGACGNCGDCRPDVEELLGFD